MSDMTITLYMNNSPNEKVTKDLTKVADLTGTLREESSIISPVITIERSSPTGFNYVYIPDFGRYYFVQEVDVVRTGLIRMHLKSDPLMSFATQIRANSGIIRKNANQFNVMINDNSIRTYQNDIYSYYQFANGFGEAFTNVLLVAGS